VRVSDPARRTNISKCHPLRFLEIFTLRNETVSAPRRFSINGDWVPLSASPLTYQFIGRRGYFDWQKPEYVCFSVCICP
jgi:hypothetical protein